MSHLVFPLPTCKLFYSILHKTANNEVIWAKYSVIFLYLTIAKALLILSLKKRNIIMQNTLTWQNTKCPVFTACWFGIHLLLGKQSDILTIHELFCKAIHYLMFPFIGLSSFVCICKCHWNILVHPFLLFFCVSVHFLSSLVLWNGILKNRYRSM